MRASTTKVRTGTEKGNLKPQTRFWILISVLILVILAVSLSACGRQDADIQPADTQVCFPQGSDILVSNSDEIPSMRIIEIKTLVMVSKPGRGNLCGIAMAFMEQVRVQGGNAVIGFSSMVITDAMPRTVIAFYGTAVVVEPVDGQMTKELSDSQE